MHTIGPEHIETRLPLVERLIELGWDRDQIQFFPEFLVPKTPSEASKREARRSYQGFPVDVALFDDAKHRGDWEHLSILFETKKPNVKEGLNQLEIYLSLEPRVLVGFWTNGTEVAALYRTSDGRFRRELSARLPKPTDNLILSGLTLIKWSDLEPASAKSLKRCFERLLDHVVSSDAKSTRRDDQLNQLCNLLLIKLESDKRAKFTPDEPVLFQVWQDEKETYRRVSEFFSTLRLTHNDLFSSLVDRELNLDPSTVQRVCYELAKVKVLDTSMDVISSAFQVFRTASLKSEEGQYFTPLPVIKSAVRLMNINYDDQIIDPACGTGGFLVECFRQLTENHPTIDEHPQSHGRRNICTASTKIQ